MSETNFGQRDTPRNWSRKIREIMDEMDTRSFCDFRSSDTWQPTVNIYETRVCYRICVELAGVEPESISVECLDPQRVCLAGQRARPVAPEPDEPFSVELLEIDEGPFHREIELHEPVEHAIAELKHGKGYLWIILRKITTK